MDGLGRASHYARVRVLPHIKKLNDCVGDFLVRATGPQVRLASAIHTAGVRR